MQSLQPDQEVPDPKDFTCLCFEIVGDNVWCPEHGGKGVTALELINWSISIAVSVIVLAVLVYMFATGRF